MKKAFVILLVIALFLGALFIVQLLFFDKGPPHVFLITIDTLRADRLGCYGYPVNTSPTIDSFSQEGVLFERHYAQAPLTLPSHASILTGLYPFQHGIRANAIYKLTPSALSLAEILNERRYRTGAIISAGILHPCFGLGQGFELYSWDAEKTKSMAQTDAEFATQRAIEWMTLREGKDSNFLWIHYYDPHDPMKPPPRFRFAKLYDGEVAYADEQVGVFLNYLKKEGLYESSFVIITSDHGQNLGEHDYGGHTLSLYEQTMRIPMIIKFPYGEYAGIQVSSRTRSIDLFPTLLSALGIPVEDKVDGLDLMGAIAGKEAFQELDSYGETHFTENKGIHKKTLFSGQWKLISKYNLPPDTDLKAYLESQGDNIVSPQARRGEKKRKKILRFEKHVRELYNIVRDRKEGSNLYYEHPDLAIEMEKKLENMKPEPGREIPAKSYTPDEDLKEKLRTLGYLE